MASKIDVESGNPYRDRKGLFGESPDKKLADSFKGLQGKSFVPKGGKGKKGGNDQIVAQKKKEAEKLLKDLREGKVTGSSGWKASGTAEEAEAFAKNSKIQDTIFHGTTSSAASSIKESGFNLDSSTSDRFFGDGVYLAGDKETSDWYARKADGNGGGESLEMKVNVQNPYIEDINTFSYKVGKYSVNQFTFDMYNWGVDNKKWKNPDDYENKVDKLDAYNKATREFANHLLETHDAIVQKNSKGIEIMIVKDPKNIMVINHG